MTDETHTTLPEAPREFYDRAFQLLFENPLRVQELTVRLSPEVAQNLDFTQAQQINRSQLGIDLSSSTADIIYKIPIKNEDKYVLMYVLLENQSSPDRLMAYRIFALMSMIWRKDLDIQRDNGINESQLKLLPILAIVLYTGKRRWEHIPTLHDLMELPEVLKEYIPDPKILFLNLEEVDANTLHHSPVEVALRLMRAENTSEEEFRTELELCIDELQNLTNMEGMSTLVRLFLLISLYRRSHTEWPVLYNIIKKSISDDAEGEETREMYMTMADQLISQGKQEGIKLGKQEGKQEGIKEGLQLGKIQESRAILLELGSDRLGDPDEQVLYIINSLTDHDVILNLLKKSSHAESWQDLIDTL